LNIDEFDSWLRLFPRPPLVMGVMNITPDSFSDGGSITSPEQAVIHAQKMLDDGADIIDIGAESTRPGSQPVPEEIQIGRLEPVLDALRSLTRRAAFSIDTTRAAIAEMAFDHGFAMSNDVSAGRDDPAMLSTVARHDRSLCLMHMLGTPATMQVDPIYADVSREVATFLESRTAAAVAAGIPAHRVLVDPGIGFGKTDAHNLELLRNLRNLAPTAQPIMVGTSRKGFIGRITGEPNAAARQFGTAATVSWSITNGCDIVRVHDVRQMAQVVRMTMAIQPRSP